MGAVRGVVNSAKRRTKQPGLRTPNAKPKISRGNESALPKKLAFKLDKPSVAPGIEHGG